MTASEIIGELKKNYSEKNVLGMARYGINVQKAFGVSVPFMRNLAKKIGTDQKLSLQLWETGYHEARHIASMIGDPELVTKQQMNNWVNDFNSWDICDGTCSNLFRKTPHAYEKILEWVERKNEYERRAGFALLCVMAVHDKNRNDKDFLKFLPLIKKHSVDERNFVKKAVNWSLRQIGKRSKFLNKEALKTAKEIIEFDSASSRWIARDAIRELTDPKILKRIKR